MIFAPSDVTSFYTSSAARKKTLALKNVTLPKRIGENKTHSFIHKTDFQLNGVPI